MAIDNNTDIAWSDEWLGKQWTEQHNCYYWTSAIILHYLSHHLPIVEGLTFFQRARSLIKEEKANWETVTHLPSLKHFDIVLMRHIGSTKNAHHLGVWTEANNGGIVHAVEHDVISLDSSVELALRGYEIKRVMRCLK